MKIDLLDHGYVQFIESWGSDERIIEAARMSTNKGFQGWGCKGNETGFHTCGLPVDGCKESGDEKLLAYLWNNKHATPFEMAGMVVEVQAPIFVFREWHRHRTQSYNELSARYTPLPDVNYIPTVERLMVGSDSSNKQAGRVDGAKALEAVDAEVFQFQLRDHYSNAEHMYQSALAHGVPKELARIGLPVGRYSRMRASANLRNWFAFLTLRCAPNAQYEIRVYANAVGQFIERSFPRTWELFAKGNRQ